jgi:hypothetical protein
MENTRPTCLKCVKIGYLINNGASLEEIKAIFTQEELIKKVVNKSYDSIPHLSKSRLGEADSHIDPKQEAFLTEQLPPIDCILYVEEKMDGSNCAVIRKNGEIIPISRSGYRCQDSNFEQHRRFHKYVMDRKEVFEKLLPDEDDRVVGEWLAMAHGTIYPHVEHPYQVFELLKGGKKLGYEDKKEIFDKHGFVMAPLLMMGTRAIPIEEALQVAIEHNPLCEGVVYRLERYDKKMERYVPHIIAKIVRMDKEDGKYLNEQEPIWLWQERMKE